MTENLKIIGLINKSFESDKFSMYYNGDFDDEFTERIISIAEFDTDKKSKRRLSFLISESFQNIVRHGDKSLHAKSGSLFGLRGDDEFVHIFSSNKVDSKAKEHLQNKLSEINSLSKDEIKAYYLKVLAGGEFSNKGGAGLGLIEMAKKSGRPLQLDFSPTEDEKWQFSMQIDLPIDKNNDEALALDVDENVALNKIINSNNILFLYKGEFNDELLTPMLSILQGNTLSNEAVSFSIFHTAVELMQNINRHGVADENGKIEGVFAIQEFQDYFYLSTGNRIKDSSEEFQEHIDFINSCKIEELNQLYRKILKKSVTDESNSAGVGLIDLRRIIKNNIDLRITKNSDESYSMIGIKIPKI